jgi:hypothetical protein
MRLPQGVQLEIGSHLRRVVVGIEQLVNEGGDRARSRPASSLARSRGRSPRKIGGVRVGRAAYVLNPCRPEQCQARGGDAGDCLCQDSSTRDGRLSDGEDGVVHRTVEVLSYSNRAVPATLHHDAHAAPRRRSRDGSFAYHSLHARQGSGTARHVVGPAPTSATVRDEVRRLMGQRGRAPATGSPRGRAPRGPHR